DLDHFKRINDVFGHDAGDRLLIEIAKFLGVQPLFGGRVYRYGGDEFVAFAEGCAEEDLREQIGIILRRYAQPWKLPGTEAYCTSSIGVARFPQDGDTYDKLINASDTAMYVAKRMGKNTFAFYDPADDNRVEPALEKETALRRAVAEGCLEFKLLLHPLVDAKTELWIGAEYLVRWESPEYGLLRPAEFIPLCEKLGLMAQLGEWIVRMAIESSQAFQKYDDFCVGINTSSLQVLSGQLAAYAEDAAKKSGVDPGRIMFELTNSEEIETPERVIERLRKPGFLHAADGLDLSFYMMPFVKFDMVKVDCDVGMRCLESEFDRELARSLVRLAHTTGTKICAEGVWNAETKEFLTEIGYDYLQGFYFAEPAPIDDFILALERNRGMYEEV
ncbi:MAG: EAL domain-containing protein, partial [Defluviitaleaceae bacterium]|nr:EAL domain-containing protein [Defluviitaleaceae bacterium]